MLIILRSKLWRHAGSQNGTATPAGLGAVAGVGTPTAFGTKAFVEDAVAVSKIPLSPPRKRAKREKYPEPVSATAYPLGVGAECGVGSSIGCASALPGSLPTLRAELGTFTAKGIINPTDEELMLILLSAA